MRTVPSDAQGHMHLDALRRACEKLGPLYA